MIPTLLSSSSSLCNLLLLSILYVSKCLWSAEQLCSTLQTHKYDPVYFSFVPSFKAGLFLMWVSNSLWLFGTGLGSARRRAAVHLQSAVLIMVFDLQLLWGIIVFFSLPDFRFAAVTYTYNQVQGGKHPVQSDMWLKCICVLLYCKYGSCDRRHLKD